jgi:hypothetical protein
MSILENNPKLKLAYHFSAAVGNGLATGVDAVLCLTSAGIAAFSNINSWGVGAASTFAVITALAAPKFFRDTKYHWGQYDSLRNE